MPDQLGNLTGPELAVAMAEAPAGQELFQPDPAAVIPPELVDLENGKALFQSREPRLCIPVRNRTHERRNGHLVVTDPGHVLQFKNGFLVADDVMPVERIGKKNATEAAILREMIKNQTERGDSYGLVEIVEPKAPVPVFSAADTIAAFQEMELAELRDLFTSAEIEEHKLATATKDRLVIVAVSTGKEVPALV